MAGRFAAAERQGRSLEPLPVTTALGALIGHITGGHISDEAASSEEAGKPRSFQPMNVNFGLFPPLDRAPKALDGKRLRGTEKAQAKKRALTDRARADLGAWLGEAPAPLPAEARSSSGRLDGSHTHHVIRARRNREPGSRTADVEEKGGSRPASSCTLGVADPGFRCAAPG